MYGISLNIDKVTELLNDFYNVTGIRVAYISYDNSISVCVPDSLANFCDILRKDSLALKKCLNCDNYAFDKVNTTGKLYVYNCHAGLMEAVAPLKYKNKLQG